MALPISPPPKSDDVAVHGWSGVTVRVAWTLLTLGVKVRREVLDAAREHVLHHLPAAMPLSVAEDRAGHLTRSFVARARGRTPDDPWPGDANMPLTERWLRAIKALRDRDTRAVFRMHYGDNRSLEHIQTRLGVDGIAVETAREGIREVLRGVARTDGLPLDTWPAKRLDRVLRRLAAWAPDTCPPTYDVVNGAHHTHVRSCPRCNRLVRLMHTGTLELQDVLAPASRARPKTELTLLVLHFHPKARAHRDALKASLPGDPVALDDDLLLLPLGDRDAIHTTLRFAAELRRPERHLLRGTVVQGAGGWSKFGPLGPLGTNACREVRNRSWGVIDGLGSLPEPLAEPPPASLAWALVSAMAVAAGLTLWLASTTASVGKSQIFATFVDQEDAVLAHFDVPESRSVSIVAGHDLSVVMEGTSLASKASAAVGDGSYVAELPPGAALLIAHDEPVELASLLASVRSAPDPLSALSDAVTAAHPGSLVFRHAP